MKIILTTFLLFTISFLHAQTEKSEESFSFRLVSTPGNVELQAEEGCDWLTLGFSLWQDGDAVIINQTGMLGSDVQKMEEHHPQSTFLFKMKRTREGFEFSSYKGTNWVELKTDCEEEYCSFLVNADGIELFEE